jgi:hypothetical protein
LIVVFNVDLQRRESEMGDWWEGLTDEEVAAEGARRADRWWYFDATVRVRAESEADGRRKLYDNQLYVVDGSHDDGSFWGPFVAFGPLLRTEPVDEARD